MQIFPWARAPWKAWVVESRGITIQLLVIFSNSEQNTQEELKCLLIATL